MQIIVVQKMIMVTLQQRRGDNYLLHVWKGRGVSRLSTFEIQQTGQSRKNYQFSWRKAIEKFNMYERSAQQNEAADKALDKKSVSTLLPESGRKGKTVAKQVPHELFKTVCFLW